MNRRILTHNGQLRPMFGESVLELGRRRFFAKEGEEGGEGGEGENKGGTSWRDGLDDEYRTHPSLQKYDSVNGLAKSQIELQKLINAKGVIVPVEGSSDEVIGKFHNAIGRPETSDKYAFDVAKDLHEGVVSTPETQKDFKDMAHKVGLTSKQAASLHSWYLKNISDGMTQQDEADKMSVNEANTALSGKYGTLLEAKKALVTKMVGSFAGEGMQKKIAAGLGADPEFIEMMVNLGEKMSEDSLGKGFKFAGDMTPESASAKIDAIRADKDHPFNVEGPLHKAAVDEMTALYQIAGSLRT